MEDIKTVARTRRIGGSIVVTIPRIIVDEQNIGEDELIEINVKKRKFNGFGALKEISSFEKDDRARGQLDR